MSIYLGGDLYIGNDSLIEDAIQFVGIYVGCLLFFTLFIKEVITKKVALDLMILASVVAMTQGFLHSQVYCSGSLCHAPLLAVNRVRLLYTMFYDSLLPFIFLLLFSVSHIKLWLQRILFVSIIIIVCNILNLNFVFMLI